MNPVLLLFQEGRVSRTMALPVMTPVLSSVL